MTTVVHYANAWYYHIHQCSLPLKRPTPIIITHLNTCCHHQHKYMSSPPMLMGAIATNINTYSHHLHQCFPSPQRRYSSPSTSTPTITTYTNTCHHHNVGIHSNDDIHHLRHPNAHHHHQSTNANAFRCHLHKLPPITLVFTILTNVKCQPPSKTLPPPRSTFINVSLYQ